MYSSTSKWGTECVQTSWYPKLSTAFWTHCTLLHSVLPFSCHTSIFSDEFINFFIGLYRYMQLTGRLMDDVCVHIFKMLYLSSTLLASMQAFPYACWSHTWMSNVISSLTRNSICMFLKWHVLASHFLALRYDHMMGTSNMIFTLVWHNRWIWSLYTVHWNILWQLFVTPWCSLLLVWPYCYIVSSCGDKINIKKFCLMLAQNLLDIHARESCL